jgi:hypothetical protein
MDGPSEKELTERIAAATRLAVADLFREYPGHDFYYCSLITSGEGLAPVLTAWSKEALQAAVKKAGNDPSARDELKWSYADSPFYGFGEKHFTRVNQAFDSLPTDGAIGIEARLRSMEEAMARLDREGFFGSGSKRLAIVINVEVMPPDHTNVERARRLNPPEALTEWLVEAAEDG